MTTLPTPTAGPTEQEPPERPAALPPRRFRGARVLSDGVPQIFLVAWALMVIPPMLWVLLSSFKNNQEIFASPFGIPEDWQLTTYVDAWAKADIGQFFLNSVIVVSFGVALTLLFSAMTAYVLARYPFPGSRAIYYLFIVGMTFPLSSR
jgi:N-acetylglucosamine transport system permease protein